VNEQQCPLIPVDIEPDGVANGTAEAGSAMKATNNPINILCTIFIPPLPMLRA
jgi:hypothetical protein